MRNAFTMRFSADVAEFVQIQARASNRSVTNFVETLLLREKARVEETERHLSVQVAADLRRHDDHELVRDAEETETEHAARAALFSGLLDRAQRV